MPPAPNAPLAAHLRVPTRPAPPPPATGTAQLAVSPPPIDKRCARVVQHLLAWADILESLGWSVALRLPGNTVHLGPSAQAGMPHPSSESWDRIHREITRQSHKHLVLDDDILVWCHASHQASHDRAACPPAGLSKRECEVLEWLMQAKTSPEIAIILGCSKRTVENHVASILRKLKVRSRNQLFFACCEGAPPATTTATKLALSDVRKLERMLVIDAGNHYLRPLKGEFHALAERCRLLVMWAAVSQPLAAVAGIPPMPAEASPFLTRKEASILCMLLGGISRQQIAEQLQWRRDSLDRHLARIHKQLGCDSHAQMLRVLSHLRPPASQPVFRALQA